MATTLLSLPASHQKTLFAPQRPYTYSNAKTWSLSSTTTLVRCSYPSNTPVVVRSSSSSTNATSSVVEDVPPPPPASSPDALPDQSEPSSEDPQKFPLRACGKEEIEKGCNGEGRIQGGIATVPGFGWWPIKAYRPCPAFLASGGRYRRQGQSMDEVVSGQGRRAVTRTTDNEIETGKKGRDRRRFKR